MIARFIGIAVVLSLGLDGSAALAQTSSSPDHSVEVVGESEVKKKNIAQAKDDALQDAMEKAVLSVAERTVPNKVFAQNQDIIIERVASKPRKFIKDYKILGESHEENLFQLSVKLEPREDRVHEELVRWGIIFDRAQRPRFGLFPMSEVIKNKAVKTKRSRKWTALLMQRLRNLGYLVDGLKSEASGKGRDLASTEAKHDVSVWGQVTFKKPDQVSFVLQAARRKPYTRMAKTKGRFKIEESDHATAGMLATKFLEKFLPSWFIQVGEGRVYEVSVSGFPSGRPYEAFLEVLNSGRHGFSSGRELVYAPGEVTFKVVYDGSVFDLVKALKRVSLPGIKFSVQDVKNRYVKLQVK